MVQVQLHKGKMVSRLGKQLDASQRFLRGLQNLPSFSETRARQLSQLLATVERVQSLSVEETNSVLERLSGWLQAVQPESPSGGLAASASEEHVSVEVCLCKHELQGWAQVCCDTTDISEELKASAEHVSALCDLLRSRHRDRWCAEAVLLLRQTEKEWTTLRAQIL